jgi:hypothetical protein
MGTAVGGKGSAATGPPRGKLNSIRVEFEDGFKMITSRNAVRKAPARAQ